MKIINKLLIKVIILIAQLLGRKIYDSKYLKGRYFENNSIGWIWVLKGIIFQKMFAINRDVPWPVAHTILVNNWKNISFHPDDLHVFHTGGTYFQAQDAHLKIGKGTWIAPNVGLITTNHDIYNIDEHVEGKNIVIGEKCWIGMNAVILPGVEIGAHTIVAAGAVVTKSFPDGYSVIGGVPAKIIKVIDRDRVVKE